MHGTSACESVRAHHESSLAQLYGTTNLYTRLEKAHDRDQESMIVYLIDLLGQAGMWECCNDGRPGERMDAISENVASSGCSHDVRMLLRCMRRGGREIKERRDSHYPKLGIISPQMTSRYLVTLQAYVIKRYNRCGIVQINDQSTSAFQEVRESCEKCHAGGAF